MKKEKYIFEILRICLGLIFLWAFLDKLLGLGFTTASDKSWLMGTSPTLGFLSFASKGPLSIFFKSIAGNPIVDWLFMLGLLLVGLSLILGIFMRIATYSGSLMMFLMWLAVLPPEHHPFLDEHIIYGLVLLLISETSGYWLGLRRRWRSIGLIKKYPIFE